MSSAQNAKPKAYSYIRFSTPEQAGGDSLRRQTDAARRYAAQNGLELDESLTFRDLGVSALRGRNAEVGALGAFLAAVRDEQVAAGSYLLVESLDRISRQTVNKAVRTLESIAEAGITIVDLSDNGRSYNAETYDSEPFAYVMMSLRFIRAHEESATKGMRVAAAYERKRAEAASENRLKAPFTRRLPAWLRWDEEKSKYALIPERARVLGEIFKKADAGWGQLRIANWLNSRGLTTWAGGKRWHRSYIRKLLVNKAVIGTFTPHKLEKSDTGKRIRKPLKPIPDFWPAAIDKAIFRRMSARTATGAPRGRHAGKTSASIFAGSLRCSCCGGLAIRVSKGEHVYLVCSQAHARGGCRYQAVRYGDVERAMVSNTRALCNAAPRGERTKALEKEAWNLDEGILDMRREAEDLVDELARTRSNTVRKKLRELEQTIEQADARGRQLRDEIEQISEPFVSKRIARLREALLERPLDVVRTNRAIKDAFDRMALDPEKGALTFHWRHTTAAPFTISFPSRHLAELSAVKKSSRGGRLRAK